MRRINRIIAVITTIICVVISISACADHGSVTDTTTASAEEQGRELDIVTVGETGEASPEPGETADAGFDDQQGEKPAWEKAIDEKSAEMENRRAKFEEIHNEINDIKLHIRSLAIDLNKYKVPFGDFALKLFKECRNNSKDEGDILLSPLSVFFALAMTANGARENTLAQIEEMLGMSVNDLNEFVSGWSDLTASVSEVLEKWNMIYNFGAPVQQKFGGLSVNTANSAWLKDDPGLHMNRDYLDLIQNAYAGELFTAAFDDSTIDDINVWIEENTNGMIKNMVTSIDDSAVLFLINTLLFEGKWENTFSKERVQNDVFTTAAGEKTDLPFMHGSASKYFEDSRSIGIKKDYAFYDYSFAAIMPNEGIGIDEYLSDFGGNELVNALFKNTYDDAYIELSMPKYSTECRVEMKDILAQMGMPDAFDSDTADLSGMGTYDRGKIYVQDVIHKTYIEVDEEGTKAGAATAMMAGAGGGPTKIINVDLNRPFIYMIIDENAQIPLFIGAFEG